MLRPRVMKYCSPKSTPWVSTSPMFAYVRPTTTVLPSRSWASRKPSVLPPTERSTAFRSAWATVRSPIRIVVSASSVETYGR